ncbi:unnamed protein product, partial [Ectocarpus fasciculatus]
KRQRKASAPRTKEQGEGGGTSATTSSPMTGRAHGQQSRCCQEEGCATRPSYGKRGTKKAEFCSQHAKP